MNKKLISRFVASASAVAMMAAIASQQASAQTANSYITPQKPLAVSVVITSTANVTLLNCSTNPCISGAIVEAINVVLVSTIAHTVGIFLCTSACPSSAVALGYFSIPLGAGSSVNTNPINLLSTANLGGGLPIDNNANRYIFIPANFFLTLTDTQSTASQPMHVTTIGASY